MTNITIEQLRSDKWVAEVEVGGFVAKREHLTAASRPEIIMLVVSACDKLEAQDPKRVPIRGPHSYDDVDPAILADELTDERLDERWQDKMEASAWRDEHPIMVVPAAEAADMIAAGVDPRYIVVDEQLPETLDAHAAPEPALAPSVPKEMGPYLNSALTEMRAGHNLPKRGRPRKVS